MSTQPATRNTDITYVEIEKYLLQTKAYVDNDKQQALLAFNRRMASQPPVTWVKTNSGIRYIPIRIIETLLRSVFGVYQIEWAATPYQLGNSVVASVHLKVLHPILNEWIVMAGTGAVPIQLNAKEKNGKANPDGARHALDFERMNPMALHKNIPAAKGFAVNNAAKQLGNLFGATLNSDTDEMTPLIDTHYTSKNAALAQLTTSTT